MNSRILVVNPNSSAAVTRGIDAAVLPLRSAQGPQIECLTLAEGPPAIESQRDVDAVVSPLVRLVQQRHADSAAFVIACYSDPGLHALRETTDRPVLGINECALATALTLGQRIGVVAILRQSIPRHLRLWGAMGLTSRLAGELALGLGVAELADAGKTAARLFAVAKALRDQHGADVLVMGCAGMAAYRQALQQQVGLPVVEPTQAAVVMALGRVRLDWEGLGIRHGPDWAAPVDR